MEDYYCSEDKLKQQVIYLFAQQFGQKIQGRRTV
jgi:hypothetical protein